MGPSKDPFEIDGWDKKIINELYQAMSPSLGVVQYTGKNGLNDIYFIDENNGWAVGENSPIRSTNDGGKTWKSYSAQKRSSVYGIHAFGINHFITIGTKCAITDDGGNTWTGVAEEFTRLVQYLDIFFINEKKGWAVGAHLDRQYTGTEVPTVIHMTDGGQTWQVQRKASFEWISSVFFIDEQKGWAVGSKSEKKSFTKPNTEYGYILGKYNPTVFKTVDGGLTWTTSTLNDANIPMIIKFIDGDVGFILDYGCLYKTEDAGITWQKKELPINKQFTDMCFVNQNVGWIVGREGSILKTEDGGNNWELFNAAEKVGLNAVYFVKEDLGWLAGEKGVIIQIKNEYDPRSN